MYFGVRLCLISIAYFAFYQLSLCILRIKSVSPFGVSKCVYNNTVTTLNLHGATTW